MFARTFNATQSYLEVYNCDYNTARANGYKLLTITHIKREIEKLKAEKRKALLVEKDDIVEKMMRIAFSDIKNFAEWGNIDDKNYVNFKDSNIVDGELIHEIKQGKDGATIKLNDSIKALEWLSNYFIINPLDKHRKEYDNNKLRLDKSKFEHTKKIDNKKIELEEKKLNTDTKNEDRVIIVEGEDKYLEWKNKKNAGS